MPADPGAGRTFIDQRLDERLFTEVQSGRRRFRSARKKSDQGSAV